MSPQSTSENRTRVAIFDLGYKHQHSGAKERSRLRLWRSNDSWESCGYGYCSRTAQTFRPTNRTEEFNHTVVSSILSKPSFRWNSSRCWDMNLLLESFSSKALHGGHFFVPRLVLTLLDKHALTMRVFAWLHSTDAVSFLQLCVFISQTPNPSWHTSIFLQNAGIIKAPLRNELISSGSTHHALLGHSVDVEWVTHTVQMRP